MNSLRQPARPTQPRQSMMERVRQFTPNWFAVTMGNGIVLLILESVPAYVAWQSPVALALWCFNAALYAFFVAMFVGRCVFFPDTVRPLLHHPIQSMFLGAIPMGLVPVINGLVLFGERYLGGEASTLALAFWTVDAVLAVVIAIAVPYLMFTEQQHAPEALTAVLLLPVVGPEVLASSAAVLAPHLALPAARAVVLAGYVLWAISVPLAFSILTIIFFRLVIHKLPPVHLGPSSWLTLGPIGTGALGLLALGQVAPAAFEGTPLQAAALIARDMGIVSGLLLWGAGLWWFGMALMFMVRYGSIGLPFNLGWWAFTFPPGVYTLATLRLGQVSGFAVFGVTGQVLAAAVVVLWAIVIVKTVQEVARGRLFQAPCLLNAEPSAATASREAR
ncbi:TDT family transporter [Burkholderia ambifaria]|uniref:TDT family transporter n=1 Tax=Burkholderia ambifaria TaxID=152480 RepID=UPI001FC82271|nr:TDT family transporter [Burkholderia ambifaria]